MIDELDQLSDAELNEIFAVEVARLTEIQLSDPWEVTDPPDEPVVMRCIDPARHGLKIPLPEFSTDAGAVLPYLERAGYKATGNRAGDVCATTIWVLANPHTGQEVIAQADYETTQNTFARAAVIALIRAARARKATP